MFVYISEMKWAMYDLLQSSIWRTANRHALIVIETSSGSVHSGSVVAVVNNFSIV